MKPSRSARFVVFDARRALGMTQAQFGPAIGGSHRSTVRWEGGESTPGFHQYVNLATLLYPRNRDLAEEVAAYAGETLVSLKLEPPPAPPAPPPAVAAAPPVTAARAKAEDLVDILVLAGMVESGGAPADVRRWIHAVMKRACDVGLTVEEAEKALRPPPAPAPTAATKAGASGPAASRPIEAR